MREGRHRRPAGRRVLALVGSLAALGLAAPAAPAAAAPVNDDYVASLALNHPGTPLNHADTLGDSRDTTGATVQSDILNPPLAGGPPEPTSCQGVRYGATVWYDFHPDLGGSVRIRAAGYATVITLLPLDPVSLLPDLASSTCALTLGSASRSLDAPVVAGRHYVVQVGGVNGQSGPLDFRFEFALPPISAAATLRAQSLATGIRVESLKVRATGGTRIEVRCSRGCKPQVRSAKTVRFPRLTGARLPAGARLQIFVTAPGAIGAYIEYRIRPGGFTGIHRCLNPGSRRPVVCR